MAAKTPSKAAKAYPPLTSREAADEAIHEIGDLLRAKATLEASLEEKVADLKAKTAVAVKPLADEIDAKIDALHAWAEANKAELLEGERRSVRLPQGTLGWRWDPPAVKVKKGQDDTVIAALERLSLGDLVRTKKEIDKEAILADPKRIEGIAGVKVEQKERFWVKPAEIEVEEVKTSRTVRGADVARRAPANPSARAQEKAAA